MSAPKGNRFWEARSRHGVRPLFEPGEAGAQKLYESCCDYFEWVEANPLWESKVASDDGSPTIVELPKLRAMSIGAICNFIDVNVSTWEDWRTTRQDLAPIVAWAEQNIRQQKFEGASAGLLNANIISRDLGLAEKRELTGPGGGPIQQVTGEMSPQEAAEAYARTRDGR